MVGPRKSNISAPHMISTSKSMALDSLELTESELPLDSITVKILSLQIPDGDPRYFTIRVSFFEQLILTSIIKAVDSKTDINDHSVLATGSLNYDPSDYEKMCLFADTPLKVHMYPYQSKTSVETANRSPESPASETESSKSTPRLDTMCCNIDILHVFLGDEENVKFYVKKRMEPIIKPSVLNMKSWDCLPLLTLEVSANLNMENVEHHEVLKHSNWMQMTVIGAYNMLVPFNEEFLYTVASKTPIYCERNTGLITFSEGFALPRRFDPTSFYPQWETIRNEDPFAKGDAKFECKLQDIKNPDNIDLKYYIERKNQINTVIWGSFHRTLLLDKSCEDWMLSYIRHYQWPLELHLFSENNGYSFMALLNLYQLLYPGENKVVVAVPLEWINAVKMLQACDCSMLLTNENAPSSSYNTADAKVSRIQTTESEQTSSSAVNDSIARTGADENNAFVLLEVKLGRPLRQISIPQRIPQADIMEMLKQIETAETEERICTGLGQLTKDWQTTVRTSASSLRRVPYCGTTDFHTFIRQLSETRTRVELVTSFWQDAAVYVNNKFVVKQYLHSSEVFEELVMMAHVCLMKIACETLLGTEESDEIEIAINAARQARQMQDTEHAMELYMQLVVLRPNHANSWRELSTCLKDINREWATVCLNKSVVLNPRHPLTLVSKGGMVYEEDPVAAEMFFKALISYYPFWTTAWIVASAYFYDRQQFLVSDKILDVIRQSRRVGETEEMGYARSWERELGDWWDTTPLLPGMNPYYDAADLLLRLRCVALAEVCVARALTCSGESPAYFHLVALCCRLRGRYEDALCHLHIALDKFGEINYLRTLEAECYLQLNDVPASLVSYEKAGCTGGPFTILMAVPAFKDSQRIRPVLVELVRHRPSAYSWMALADDWMAKAGIKEVRQGDITKKTENEIAAVNAATACAEQALKWDRLAGPAWAFLATVVRPSARRYYCLKMAAMCGYKIDNSCLESDKDSRQSLCYRLGKPVRLCRCKKHPHCKQH